MVKTILALFCIIYLVGVVLASPSPFSRSKGHQKYAVAFCLAQRDASADKMQGFLDYACGVVDCGAIQPGGSCFEPNNLHAHTSYALNKLCRIGGNCNLDIGYLTTIDPSHGACRYPTGP